MSDSNPVQTAAERLLQAGVTWETVSEELRRIETQTDSDGWPILFPDETVAAELLARLMPDDPLPANPSTR